MPTTKEHVSLWHPWKDKPGQRHTLALWSDFDCSTIDEMVSTIGGGKYYAFCNDILDGREVQSSLLRDSRTDSYISKTGNAVALRIRHKRNNGFLITGSTWGCKGTITKELTETVSGVFRRFGYESLTPSSLSERVLRSTLSNRLYINRPTIPLRDSLIRNSTGPRIGNSKSCKSPFAYEYDQIKSYLHHSRNVPTPFIRPVRFVRSDIWQTMPCSWLEARMTCKGHGIQPIQLEDRNGELREPINGETFTKWLWNDELQDCLDAGYVLDRVYQGWSWPMTSDFMSVWSDILWNEYQNTTDQKERDIEKNMMVGLPGRFLKKPEKYTLVHRDEALKTDMPIVANWKKTGDSPLSEWCMRVEEDIESAQLTYIGAWIIKECRRDIYHAAKGEELNGNKVLRIYVDSFTTTEQSTTIEVGTVRGKFKLTKYRDAKVKRNRFVAINVETGEVVSKLPGVSGIFRKQEIAKWDTS